MADTVVFFIAALVVLGGAIGVIVNTNPVRAALSLIASFFGVALLFILQAAHFLALVQVVVYGGAVVVLFLFVIMLLGVDTTEDLNVEPIEGQRVGALVVGAAVLGLLLAGLFVSGPGGDRGAVALTGHSSLSGVPSVVGEAPTPNPDLTMRPFFQTEPHAEPPADIDLLADDLFGRNLVAFEATALLLTIATVGAVVLVRNRGAEDLAVDEPGTALR